MLARLDVLTILYAVLSLTVVRTLPVALATIGAGLDRRTVLIVGWFGPRGLASLAFALPALEALRPIADEAVAVVAVTVMLSVLAHGLTAAPLAARYGRPAAQSKAEAGVRDGTPSQPRNHRRQGADWWTSASGSRRTWSTGGHCVVQPLTGRTS
jgi:sodium/hydrogen antiporter